MEYINIDRIKNKKVILRLDLNVPIKNNKILDCSKIKKSVATIQLLMKQNCHILILSHLGKVKSNEDKKNNSLKLVCKELSNLLNEKIIFINKTRSEKIKGQLEKNNIVMLENTRWEDYPNKLESNCDEELSMYWAGLADVFINDAFGTSHRKHASNYGISKYIESYYGPLILEEKHGLNPLIQDTKKPFTVIMGGAKVDDKIELIKSIVSDSDYILTGGGIANTIIKSNGYNIGQSIYSEKYMQEICEVYTNNKTKILFPTDVIVLNNEQVINKRISEISNEDIICDIGEETRARYIEIISKSKTIFTNGTMGIYEDIRFSVGTREIYEAIGIANAIRIAGGGDALSSIASTNTSDCFDFLSTGGGATLDYIATKKITSVEE